MLNQFKNLSCYEEFEIQCALACISNIGVLKRIGYQIDNYYFFISNDGIFNWFDLKENHIKDPGVLKEINKNYIPRTITKCVIPNSVTNIGFGAFFECKSLKEITIPNSVTYIGSHAFYWCKSLEEIVIPNSVTNIGFGAFFDCKSLKEITISNNVLKIGRETFSWCTSLTSITIPNSVTSIGSYAFSDCDSLKSITIPNSVIDIGYNVFHNCTSLNEVIFKGKTLDEVKQMENYPFGIEDESIINCEV